MAISFKLKQDFFDTVYLKNDVQQRPYLLVHIILGPGHVQYLLRGGDGEVLEVYEGETSFERDESLRLSYNEDN